MVSLVRCLEWFLGGTALFLERPWFGERGRKPKVVQDNQK